MKNITRIMGCLVLGCAPILAFASPQSDAQFAKANQEYSSSHFKEAIEGYESLVHSGEWSAPLFYDLANAYFRSGDFGRAILNYERALALEPQHPETQANLRITRDEARALELQANSLDRILRSSNTRTYAIAGAAAFWIALFGLALLIFARRRSPVLILLTMIALTAFGCLVGSIWQSEHGNFGRSLAIVINEGVEARVATADTANSVLALPAGSEIKVLQQRGDWIYAILPNNLRGWIPAKSTELVRL